MKNTTLDVNFRAHFRTDKAGLTDCTRLTHSLVDWTGAGRALLDRQKTD